MVVNRYRLFFVCALLWLAGTITAFAAPPNLTAILGAAQDSQGQVWGAGYFTNPQRLYRWEGSGWVDAPVSFAHGYAPLALTRSDNGHVYCVWQNSGQTGFLLSIHQGRASRLVAHFTGPAVRDNGWLNYPRLFVDGDGTAWVTTPQASQLWRITPNGQVQDFPLPDAWFFPKQTPREQNGTLNPIFSLQDSRGRRWFWSNHLAINLQGACLRGVLIWDGKKLVSHPTLPGVPDKPLSVVAAKDADHFWLTLPRNGLYAVDAATLQGLRVPPPEKGAFQNIESIFRAGDTQFLADWAVTSDERNVVLWRQHQGRWEKIIPGLDKNGDSAVEQPGRPALATSQGTWIGALGGGLWWLPTQGDPPIAVDWRRGFPLSSVSHLFRLRDGRVLAVSQDQASAIIAPTPPVLPKSPPVETFLADQSLSHLITDSRGHLWGFLLGATRLLCEWDGTVWRKHPSPKSIPLDNLLLLSCDTQGRVWLLPFRNTGMTAVYDPSSQVWTKFASCEAAFQAQSVHPNFAFLDNGFALFGPKGRIRILNILLTDWNQIEFFDGRAWHKASLDKIVGDPDASVADPPFFDRADNFCVTWQGKSWEWTSEADWHSIPYEPNPEKVAGKAAPSPAGSPTLHPESIVWEKFDVAWLTFHRQLYKVAFGLSAPQFPPGAGNPFVDGRRLNAVDRDRRGNLLFSTSPDSYNDIILVRAKPAPAARLTVTPTALDAVRLTFAASEPGPHWFVWRLDGGAWSAATHDNTALLDFLPGGPHRVEALALDTRLHFNPTPTPITFIVQADAARQVQALVERLMTGDNAARERAVTRLRQFPILAPPALQTARLRADEDQRWWIDAALQQFAAR